MAKSEVKDIISLQIHNNEIVIANLQKIDGNDFLLKKVFSKKLNLTFSLDKVMEADFCESFFQEIKSLIEPENLNAEELVISFGDQAAILKTIDIDKNADKKLIYDQLEWEFLQISSMDINDYHFALPEVNSERNQKLMIAFNKSLLEFSKDLASFLNLKLSHVTLNSLCFVHLLEKHDKLKSKRLLFVLIEESYVEIGFYFFGMLQQNQFIDFSNGININTLNIQIRKMIDLIGFTDSEWNGFDIIYIAGSLADKAMAQNIANAVQIPVELVKPLEFVKLAPDIDNLSEAEESKYAISISAALQL